MKDGKIQRRTFQIAKTEIETLDDVREQRELLNDGKRAPITLLINAYNNTDLTRKVRMAALQTLAESKNPLVLEAIQKSVKNAELLDMDMMITSIKLLAEFGDSSSTTALTNALKKTENKIMNMRQVIIEAIGKNGTTDQIITLLDLYEISRTNHARNSELLSLTLGNMEDDRAIPILIDIAKNEENNLRIRKLAVDVLAQKEATELVDYFIELLGDPDSREKMNEFALEVMGGLNNERMTLALLESYQIGKQQYYSMLIRLMDSMSEEENIQIKPTLVEVALSEKLPYHIRIKAIKALPRFDDPKIIEDILPLLNDSNNYIFFNHIVDLIDALDAYNEYEPHLRMASYKAMLNEKEKELLE